MTDQATEPGQDIATIGQPTGELASTRLDAGLTAGNGVIDVARWQMLAAIAETVSATEFVPAGLRGRKPAVMAALLYGDSLGLHPMAALKGIDVIDGNPTVDAALATALIRRAGHKATPEQLVNDEGAFTGFTAHGTRGDDGTTFSFTFTLAMAARAGLMGKNNWKNYPEAMSWARAVTQLARILFPDVFMGALYDGEELEPSVPLTPPDVVTVTPGMALVNEETGAVVDLIEEATDAPQTLEAPATDDAPQEAGAAQEPARPVADEPAHAGEGETANGEAHTQEPDPNAEPGAGAPEPGWMSQYKLEEVRRHAAGFAGQNPGSQEEALAELERRGEQASVFQIPGLPADATPERIGKETGPKIMLWVADRVEHGDVAWIEGVLDFERNDRKPSPRVKLLDGLLEAYNAAKVRRDELIAEGKTVPDWTPKPVEEPAEVVEADEVIDPAVTITAVSDGGGEDLPAFNPGGEPAPAVRSNVVRLTAALRWIEANLPGETNWRLEAIVVSAQKAYGGHVSHPIFSLDDLTDEMIDNVAAAVPQPAKEALAKMTDEQIATLAEG